ncbi:hypothetical protein MTZ49_08845 [Entomomonas sp. E2T0]|uniref:hypothetical protein n=1 Tax=Entomomonas sp. E2T0 TaxID=2930213 RepID=UPI0022283DA3|nr:hypothetical protein [Entomomonas sp. E2T0]UYZ82723.1 hypothetical protein MTZ49_08845 [Entomomonas sp. E2T0]
MDYIPVDHYIYQNIPVNYITFTAISTVAMCDDLVVLNNILQQGKESLINNEFKKAIHSFNKGIQLIGNKYLSGEIKDDSEMKMLLANTEEKKGNLERAAYLKRNILETRIQIFISLNQCHKVINQIENTSYVGEAWMEENGDILLQLFIDENNSMKGQTLVRYKPCTKEFNAVLQHVGELKPGKKKGVLPWTKAK